MPARIPEGPPTHQGRHQRLRRGRGAARDEGPCENCGSPRSEWSQLHDTDGLDIWNDYWRLCRSCHQAYDDPVTGRTIHSTKTRKEASATYGIEKEILDAYFAYRLSAPEIARTLGVGNWIIYRLLKRDPRYRGQS